LKQREFEERNRLLYVAMTRPRDRLYVAGYRGVREPPPDCWYRLIEGALRPRMAAAQSADGREILRYESPQTAVPEQRRGDAAAADTALAPPEWALRRAPREVQLAIPLAPSRLAPLETDDSGEAVEPTRPARAEPAGVPPRLGADAHRFMRGTLSHALLEHLPNLPAAGRAAAAKVFLDTRARELPARTRTGIATEVLAVLADPAFAPIFGPGSRPEVPIVAAIPRPGGGLPLKLTGQIDRLLATDHEVLIVDYKTNRPPPLVAAAVADTYLLQLAAYRLAIAAIYPHRQIRAAIIWTDGCRLMELPSPMLDAAERRLWSLDIAELAAAHS
jgi:ATP-dependent helicase/nuclease subunit A